MAKQRRFKDGTDAGNAIVQRTEGMRSVREAAIDYVCEEIEKSKSNPSLSQTLLKSGLKVAMAAAAGAVGAALPGGALILAAGVGAGFEAGGQVLDKIFDDGGGSKDASGFKLKRRLVLAKSIDEEQEEIKRQARSPEATSEDWQGAYEAADPKHYARVVKLEKDATLDAWMNALSAKHHGSGGALAEYFDEDGQRITEDEYTVQILNGKNPTSTQGEGKEELNSATTGRLHLMGTVRRPLTGGDDVVVDVDKAEMEGFGNDKHGAKLRNEYLTRQLGRVGCFVTFDFHQRGQYYSPDEDAYAKHGGLAFGGGRGGVSWQGADELLSTLGNPNSGSDVKSKRWAARGARLIVEQLKKRTLADFGVKSVGN